MRCMSINKKSIWYATLKRVDETLSSGIVSREKDISYNAPVQVQMSVSPAKGNVLLEGNGIVKEYTLTAVTDQMDCPISEDTLMWVYKVPQASTATDADYRVTSISRSLNHISYGLREIENG